MNPAPFRKMSQGLWTIPRSKQTPQVAHKDQPGIITVMRIDGEGNIKERMVCGETTEGEREVAGGTRNPTWAARSKIPY